MPNRLLKDAVVLENALMRFLLLFILVQSIAQVPLSVNAAEPKAKVKAKVQAPVAGKCSQDEINNFKIEYVKLQNALKYEGRNIELKNGKVQPIGESTETDNSPGQKVAESLYNQYKNALIKVGKIYQQMSNQPTDASAKLLKENPDIAKFFKAIDPNNTDKKVADKVNIDSLLDKLKTVNIPGFNLSDEDIYLLKRLIIHSQDRICTLEKYKANNGSKTAYLDQLAKSPLNKMIDSLNTLAGNKDLKLANDEITISEAVKSSMAKLRKIVKDNKNCEVMFKKGLVLGELIQSCNYNKFMSSLSANQFNEIEAILHFINSNQKADNARTGLDWVNTLFTNEAKIRCSIDTASKAVYVVNLPLIDGQKIDPSKINCKRGSVSIKSEDCVKDLNFEFENGLGYKISPRKNDKAAMPISVFSIKGGEECNNLALQAPAIPPVDPPVIPPVPPVIPPANAPTTCTEVMCRGFVATAINLPDTALIDWDSNAKMCFYTKDSKKITICTESAIATDPCKVEPKDPAKCPVTPTEKETCEKDPKKEWKLEGTVGKCVDKAPAALTEKEKCEKQQTTEMTPGTITWKDNKCIDKRNKKEEATEKEETPPESKPEVVYPNKPIPGRFQPITIPTRQVYILPGMP